MNKYDLAIIGSGPGGYIAAIYASRHGLKTCVIEKDLTGGTCLNKGCIPTKSLIYSASLFSQIKNSSFFGVSAPGCEIDFKKMVTRKNEVVKALRSGVESLLKSNKIDLHRAQASITGPGAVSLSGSGDIEANNIIIAVGSEASSPSNLNIDNINILSSDSILNIDKLPSSLAVIGGGVIGSEFACLFSKLGVRVTIIEMADRLIPSASCDVSRRLEQVFKRSGIDMRLSQSVSSAEASDRVSLNLSGGQTIVVEKALIATGRSANIKNIGFDNVGIKTVDGRIAVDDNLMTGVKGIYAIGDCVSGPQLAHKASYDGILACDNILGRSRARDYTNIPNCIWTDPEIASVGLTEESARALSADVRIAKFPFQASGKAFIEAQTEGFVKLIGAGDGTVLGVEIVGKDACNLIGEAVLARTTGVKIGQWSHVVHGHPTLSEAFQDACHIFMKTPLNCL